MRRGFSLVEIILVVAIITIVVAISYPVAVSAKKEAYKANSVSNMRQLWMAIELYRQDHSPANSAGSPSEMGLPGPDHFLLDMVKVKQLGPPFKGPNPWLHHYLYYPPDEQAAQSQLVEHWASWSKACRDDTVLFADFNFTERRITPFTGLVSKFGLGIRLNGHLARKRALGDVAHTDWWGCSEAEVKP